MNADLAPRSVFSVPSDILLHCQQVSFKPLCETTKRFRQCLGISLEKNQCIISFGLCQSPFSTVNHKKKLSLLHCKISRENFMMTKQMMINEETNWQSLRSWSWSRLQLVSIVARPALGWQVGACSNWLQMWKPIDTSWDLYLNLGGN